MDPVQLTLIVVGLLAIVAGAAAFVVAIWTLRAGAPPPEPARDPAPTLEQVRPPAQVAAPAPLDHAGDEDEIPTTVLHVGDDDAIDAMIAAVEARVRR